MCAKARRRNLHKLRQRNLHKQSLRPRTPRPVKLPRRSSLSSPHARHLRHSARGISLGLSPWWRGTLKSGVRRLAVSRPRPRTYAGGRPSRGSTPICRPRNASAATLSESSLARRLLWAGGPTCITSHPARTPILLDDRIARPNGLTLTGDGKTLIVDDTLNSTVFAYHVQSDGSGKNKRLFAQLRGIPAGAESGARVLVDLALDWTEPDRRSCQEVR
jgi:SMP-30/Gluconolactonase/LRE-like region